LISQSLLSQEYIYSNFNTQHGLPSSEIYHVFQDSKGYIWFATDNGVSRYNGYEFENFDINDGLAESTISEIYEDRNGVIWFVGITGKLTCFSNETIEAYKYNQKLSQLLPQNPIALKSNFYVDSLQNIFISVEGLDLYKISKAGDIEAYKETSISRNTQTIYHIEKNASIIALKSSDNPIDKEPFNLLLNKGERSETMIHLPVYSKDYPPHLFVHFVNDTSIWYCSGKFIYYIENKNVRYKKPFKSNIVWMKRKSNNELWICTAKGGVRSYQIKDNTLKLKLHLLDGLTVSSTLLDNHGSQWFTTLNNGVFKLVSDKRQVLNKQSGLLDDKVSCIEVFNDTIWAGYNSNKLNIIEGNKVKHVSYSNHNTTAAKALYYEKNKDQLIVATTEYLHCLQENEIKTVKKINLLNSAKFHSPFNATDIISDGNEGYWIASEAGFYHVKYNHVIYDSWYDKNFKVRVNSLKLSKKKTLWLGCHDGLRKFENNKLIYFGNEFEKLKSRILDILIYDGFLILATKGNGILFFDGKSVKQITKEDGLNSNMITSLVIESNVLWAGSLNGINKIDFRKNNNKLQDITIQTPYELSGFEINQIKIHQSKMYLATNKGVIIYTIEKKSTPDVIPPFFLKKFTVNGQVVNLNDRYYLKRDQNNLSISFEALHYNRSLPLQYKYKLQELDTNWIMTTRRMVNYYYLSPGNYEFIAMVKNQKGEWIDPPISMKIKIAPAFWQTLPFKIGSVLLVITLLLLIYKIKLVDTQTKMRLKKKVYSYKLQTLLGQMRPHFIFNTLNSINSYIISNESRAASQYLSKFSKLIRKILEHSQYEQISLAEELQALELYLNIEAMRLRHKFDYLIKVEEGIDIFETKLPSLILQPFVENSIWHGIQPLDKKGLIRIKISKKGSTLAVEIIDNGIGREKAIALSKSTYSEKKSLSAKITKERLEVLAKKLNRETMIEYTDLYAKSKSIGTKVKISLPFIAKKKQTTQIEKNN